MSRTAVGASPLSARAERLLTASVRTADLALAVRVSSATSAEAKAAEGVSDRKELIVDGSTGWVGGAGIEDHFNDGRFHDVFVRVTGPVVAQLQLVFLAGSRWLGGRIDAGEATALFPAEEPGDESIPAVVRHNAPGPYRPIATALARLFDDAVETLDVANPYITDRRMIRAVETAARRGVRVRLFTPADGNNWACSASQRFRHARLLKERLLTTAFATISPLL